MLRNAEVMEKLRQAPTQPGQKSAILVYFGTLLGKGNLNAEESVELAKIVLGQNKKDLLANWWNENKLAASEELGDLVKNAGDNDLALKIFEKAGTSSKVSPLSVFSCGGSGENVTITDIESKVFFQ